LISPTLRSYAALDKRVMLVGQGNKFELWDEAKWQAQQEAGLSFMDGDLPPELEGFSL
jgi:MraZ protein